MALAQAPRKVFAPAKIAPIKRSFFADEPAFLAAEATLTTDVMAFWAGVLVVEISGISAIVAHLFKQKRGFAGDSRPEKTSRWRKTIKRPPAVAHPTNSRGESVNTRLKRLMKELGDAINSSLSESEDIAQVIARIKEEGYDIFLVLEATIGFNQREGQPAKASPQLVGSRRKAPDPEFSINAHDVRFLKSLRI